MKTIDQLAAQIGAELSKLRSLVANAITLPTYLGAVSATNYFRNPRAATGIANWGFSNGTGSPEGASVAQWSYKTKTGAKSVVNATGTATVAVSFKPSNAMNALALASGVAIPVYAEVWLEGMASGSTITVDIVWFGQSTTRVTLLATEAALNGKLYRIKGNWLWPAGATVTAAGTNDVSLTATIANAPAGSIIRMTNASIGPSIAKPFDGDTPDTAFVQYDWTGTPYASESTRRPKNPGIGTKMLVDNGNWVDIPSGGSGATTVDGLTDSGTAGRAVVRSETAATARTAIGAAAPADITAAINSLVGGAPGTLDTLAELATALAADPAFATTMTAALAARVRTDINNQGLTNTQKGNARTNIGAAGSLADIDAFLEALQAGVGLVATMPYSVAAGLATRPALPAGWAWRVNGGLPGDPIPSWIVDPDWQDTVG